MHGTTKALFVAAVALQANANPLFKRQASTSVLSLTSSASANQTTSSYVPTATISEAPIPTDPTFPFPGFPGGSNSTNGTYYICSFPSSNNTAPTASLPLSESSATLTSIAGSATATVSAPSLSDNVLAPDATSSRSALSAATSLLSATAPVTLPPIPSATPFTVVGPDATMTIECIQIPPGGHPHAPAPGPGPIPTASSLPSLSAPTAAITSRSAASSASATPTLSSN